MIDPSYGRVGVLGDLHGNVPWLLNHFQNYDTIIQIGDFGFSEDFRKATRQLNTKLKEKILLFVGGNHDDYDYLEDQWPKYYLGNFGSIPGIKDSYFIRGAPSIDVALRTEGVSWWRQEELDYRQAMDAVNDYVSVKPKVMFTHCAPLSIVSMLVKGEIYKSRTENLLDICFDEHKPDVWIFGHYHTSFDKVILGTRFICLDENEILHFDLNELHSKK